MPDLSADDQHALALGLEAYEAGDYFAAHEHWELAWKRAPDPERRWIQGLIQLATALFKLSQDKPEGTRKLCERAAPKLADAPSRLGDVDLATARAHVARLAAAVTGAQAPPRSPAAWSIRAGAAG